jgi:tetratricopeptide (TPR) repeat protein
LDARGEDDEPIKLDPKLAIAYANRGLVYESKGERENALADFEHALAIDPKLQRALAGRERLRSGAAAR